MHSPSAEDTSESVAEPVFKSARREAQNPDNLIAIITVKKGPYVGMELKVFERPETNLFASSIEFFMHKDSREKFPMVEHFQAKRRSDGIALECSIRLRERLLHEGTLRCATCPRLPSNGHGTLYFVIDSTTEEEPSSTTKRQHGFLEEKIKNGKAQIICRACELAKTFQGSPGNQGTCRPRDEPLGAH
jgi:hypothetical protein